MEGGIGDGNATDAYRPELGDGRERSRASDLGFDVLDEGRRLLGWKFVRDRPTRRAGKAPELPLQGQVVHLEDGAVDLDIEVAPCCQQFLVEVFGGYRPSSRADTWIVGGVRYLEVDADIDFVVLGEKSASQDFADPFIGLSWQPRRGNWEYVLEADIGGGIDADFSWSFTAAAAYHFNDRLALTGGYRFIDIDFEGDEFVFDGTIDGIEIGLMITF